MAKISDKDLYVDFDQIHFSDDGFVFFQPFGQLRWRAQLAILWRRNKLCAIPVFVLRMLQSCYQGGELV